ncbi:ABC transporter A family protein [Cavenderia fasciculata]|uniref:ABC transporter A family protein n=1 Tax=Cavenderia fasciculata TaxID=261658 RepID=F4Q0E5_CACFS|nr:ABC transporter A family protein [Cavenderia fasciculata]EGG18296.1 ABC transporter A family protein [Cavenderia fasciculata]|eukprot:XP_004357119.1 ABC transporter A family protein [Cavenderia fasciculata]
MASFLKKESILSSNKHTTTVVVHRDRDTTKKRQRFNNNNNNNRREMVDQHTIPLFNNGERSSSSSSPSVTQKASVFQQFKILMYKQLLLLAKNKVNTFLRLTFPFWVMLICLITAKSINQSAINAQTNSTFTPTNMFIDYQTRCDYTMMYSFTSENGSIVAADTDMLNLIAELLNLDAGVDFAPIPEPYQLPTSMASLVRYQQGNQGHQTTGFALVYFTFTNETSIRYAMTYYVNDQDVKNGFVFMNFNNDYYNTIETQYSYSIRLAIEKVLLSKLTNGQGSLGTVQTVKPPSALSNMNDDYAPVPIFATFTPVFLWFVEEKERKIRSYLRLFGVHDTLYLASWFFDGLFATFINTVLVLFIGNVSKSVYFFAYGNSSAIFITLMTYGISLTALAILLSSLLSRTKAAVIIAVLIFLICLSATIVLATMGSVFYGIYSKKIKVYAWLLLWLVLTPLGITKILGDISTGILGSDIFSGYNGVSKLSYYSWDDFVGNLPYESDRHITTTYASVSYMFITLVIYLVLAWYFDKIIPDDFGGRKSPLFLFQANYWFPNSRPYPIREYQLRGSVQSHDPDVLNEANCVNMSNVDHHALIVRNVTKQYGSKLAVNNLSISAERGKIVALLGHNGAGKTTLINMVSGQTTMNRGDVFIQGYDVATQMDHIRSSMGICPQFDVYWPDFSARQHLYIMTLVKETRSNINHDVDEILKSVRLSSVADNPVGSYSGGMRRRLSVAMAIIGNPQVVILDEPTTGIDPANRRYIWRLIKSIKNDKLILLTSHAMEECDQLGDKIMIMDHGRLVTVGTSLHLKNKHGSGYKLHLVSSDPENTQHTVREKLPTAKLIRINSNNIIYSVPSMEALTHFLRYLTAQKDPHITDWQIQNTSLEDVFLTLVGEEDQKKNK